jgi:predicted nuclease of predicted toxin-antitoxin system
MKFLLDVHLPLVLLSFLRWKGFEAIHVKEILQGVYSSDKAISDYADAHGLVLLTKDSDFKNSFLINGSPKKVIRIVLGNCSNELLLLKFDQNLSTLSEFKEEEFYGELGHQSIILYSK